MSIDRIQMTQEQLAQFRLPPQMIERSAQGTVLKIQRKGDLVADLIHRAAAFAQALEDAGAGDELRRRVERLNELISADSDFEKARRLATERVTTQVDQLVKKPVTT